MLTRVHEFCCQEQYILEPLSYQAMGMDEATSKKTKMLYARFELGRIAPSVKLN